MLKIETVPNYREFDIHLWADYFELNCLLSKDKEFTGADLADIMFINIKDLNAEFETDYSDEKVQETPLLKDKNELFIKDIISIIVYRSATYHDNYPFSVLDSKIILKNNLTRLQYLYLYLLLCSHLRFISRSDWSVLTSDFELISYFALKRFLPERATVRIFGTSKSLSSSHYTGKTYDKIALLANELNEKLLAEESDFAPTASKDKGVDLVAWIPFKDKQNSRLVCFGQCKCSDEWSTMRFSSSDSQWKNWIHFSNQLNNFAFIPYCYRKTGGDWFDKSSIGDVIVVDRQRLIELIEELGSAFDFSSLRSSELLTKWILENETSIV